MTSRERIEAAARGEIPDRTPVLGGWLAAPGLIQAVTGVTDDAYWENPRGTAIRAYEILQMDGLIGVFVSSTRGEFRCVDASSFKQESTRMSLDEALAAIDAMPEPERIEDEFDLDDAYARFRKMIVDDQAIMGDMVWMPAQWGISAKAAWYGEFGYENYFLILGMHERHARKLMEVGGAQGRCRARTVARAVQDGIYPHVMLMGEDICTQRGPMVSPAFLEKYFAPELERGLAPLLEVGCKPVWHCDGDVRPLLDMLLGCGVAGLQGFQPECGLSIDFVAQKRTRNGEPLVVMGPLSVTTELPVLSPAAIRERVRHAINVCRGNAGLILFTANTINPDVPLANLLAMYEEAREYRG